MESLDNKQVTIPLGEIRRIRDRLRQLNHRAPGIGLAELFSQVAGLHQRLAATSPGPGGRTAPTNPEVESHGKSPASLSPEQHVHRG